MRVGSRPIGVVVAWAVALWAAAPFAAAQDAQRPRVTVVIKSPTPTAKPAAPVSSPPSRLSQPRLREPLGLAAVASGVKATPEPVSVSLALAGASPKGGVTSLRGLNAPSASAQAAQCRAQCAKARYICTAEEGGDCDSIWSQCVVGCSGANAIDRSDLAFSATYRPER